MKNLINRIDRLEEEIYRVEMKKGYLQEEKKVKNVKGKIPIEKLPYKLDSLKKFVDPETMSYHYNKHYIGYVTKLNDALTKSGKKDADLEHIVKTISQYNTDIRNNAGGAYNHAIFWKMLSPRQQEAGGALLKMIQKNFGGIKEFRRKFEVSAKERFGSGWVWLVLTKRGTLKIMTTQNQDNPLMNTIVNGGFPLLGLDLWEHAYYLTYRNLKDKYIENFWRVVNWEYINERLKTQQDENIESDQEDPDEIIPNNFSLIETEEITEENQTGFNIKGLPITIQPEDLIDKIVYYGDKKAKVVEQINNEEFRVSTTKGKTGIMDYAEIIRQLTHIEEEDSDKWIIEDIIDHR